MVLALAKKWSPHNVLNKVTGAIVHWISLNEVRVDEEVVFKRRNPFGRRITPAANWFFRLCQAPIVFWKEVPAWQKWEVECYRMLHPQYEARAVGSDAVCQDRLPGEPLFEILKRGELTRGMLAAAAREVKRAHNIWSEEYQGLWSHGDGAMCNVLYDTQTGEAHFIDFEFTHDHSLSEDQRHADDLHAFLMDLAGFTRKREWLLFALTFLRTYGRPSVLAELRKRLDTPKGMAWWWWKIRGNFVAEGKLARRFAKLAKAMDQGALVEGAATRRLQRR